ncbi:cupin domain-containing protein [Rhodospirillum sp. A1_3_36]|uniref:cupin domain-containing protein n=1 Tax=Rhodospirillum sp. A1_3_36 TaxID=3391666 RepID=UPI0039A58DF0
MSGAIVGCLMDPVAPPGLEEEMTDLWASQGGRVERIVSHGHVTADDCWYDQDWDEWVMVVQGRARLRLAGETGERKLGPGDWIALPAGCRHRVSWTDPDEPTIWLAVHFPGGEP